LQLIDTIRRVIVGGAVGGIARPVMAIACHVFLPLVFEWAGKYCS
jgi:hypothetical protein